MEDLEWLLNWFKNNANNIRYNPGTTLPRSQFHDVLDRISRFYNIIKNDLPEYAERLFDLKNKLQMSNGYLNICIFSRISESLIVIKMLLDGAKINKWNYIHDSFKNNVKRKFVLGFYKEAIDEATNILMNRLKVIDNITSGKNVDIDGMNLVEKLFPDNNPTICICNNTTRTQRDIQKGYASFFRGWVFAIRNRNAHPIPGDLTEISAFRELNFLSMLMTALDDRKAPELFHEENINY